MWGFCRKGVFCKILQQSIILYKQGFPLRVKAMVAFVKISDNGVLLQIKEVSDQYRDRPYRWDEDE